MNRVQTKTALPWKSGSKKEVDFYVEIGTTPYGKYGMYKEMIPVGTGSRGTHQAIADSVRLSNPDIFERFELRQIVSNTMLLLQSVMLFLLKKKWLHWWLLELINCNLKER